jgi:Mg-chelatase subunit ChlD
MSKSIVPGSLGAIAQRRDDISLAETFLNAEVVVIVDTSGSMGSQDTEEGIQRYEKACAELRTLQAKNPGKVAVIGFSSTVHFYPGGQPNFLRGMTEMAKALRFAKVADVGKMTFFLISDGQPTDGENEVLQIASTYKNKINTIYCGPVGDEGELFLTQLAKVSGGRFASSDRVKELASTVETLLLEG